MLNVETEGPEHLKVDLSSITQQHDIFRILRDADIPLCQYSVIITVKIPPMEFS